MASVTKPIGVFFMEDDPAHSDLMVELLAQAPAPRPVVVLDIAKPRTDLATTIRRLSRLGARTLVLAAHADLAHVEAALTAGAHGYIVKKAAEIELLVAIRAVSSGRRFVDPHASAASSARSPDDGRLGRLSARERQVLGLIGYGFTNREIAERLRLSVKTIETFRARVCEKLELRSRAELVRYALSAGLVTAEDDGTGGDAPEGR